MKIYLLLCADVVYRAFDDYDKCLEYLTKLRQKRDVGICFTIHEIELNNTRSQGKVVWKSWTKDNK